MELIRGQYNLKQMPVGRRGSVVTIGNFDGVHLGHLQVLQHLCHRAKQMNLPAVVVVFEPQPAEYFQADHAPPRLTCFREKIVALSASDINIIVTLKFDARFAQLSPQAFIDKLLVKGLGVKQLLVGHDFRFGKNRQGDVKLLQSAGSKAGFSVTCIDTFFVANQRVSSTHIRQLLQSSQFAIAKQILGYAYRISGRVAHGNEQGRLLGFPTLNISLKRTNTVLSGVYVVQVLGLVAEQVIYGVANVGTRPTMAGDKLGKKKLLEVHCLDFSREVYDLRVSVVFLKKIRDEQKFSGLDALIAQISQDVVQARSYLSMVFPEPD